MKPDANSGPNLYMQRDSGSPADGDSIGKISFVGDNDAGETTRYARIDNQISDASDGTEDGMMFMTTMVGGTELSRMTLQPTETVFNEESGEIDFRVESDSMSHQIHMNGSNGKIAINNNAAVSPTSHFTVYFASNQYSAFAAQMTDTGNGSGFLICRKTDGSVIGQVKRNGTSDEVQYVTTSDYRLKENVNYDFDATSRLKQLKPARFNFIADADKTVDGFLAHEVSDIVPEAISGTKDAVQVWEEGEELPEGVSVGDNKLDENGNTIPEYQGIDQSKLVPLLVKTIQELEARITALETNNP